MNNIRLNAVVLNIFGAWTIILKMYPMDLFAMLQTQGPQQCLTWFIVQ